VVVLTKFELNYAYPFMSLAFVLVLLSRAVTFRETVTMAKMFGILLIMTGDHDCRPGVRFGFNNH
jgi:multidrug transporter EmrE-like cation transporter